MGCTSSKGKNSDSSRRRMSVLKGGEYGHSDNVGTSKVDTLLDLLPFNKTASALRFTVCGQQAV